MLFNGFQHGLIIGFLSVHLAKLAGQMGSHLILFASVIFLYFVMTKWFPLFKNESDIEDPE